ncbi:MAG: hypothetical protein WCJ24_02825 [Candidatus Saccharibacteria bacterium]
MYQQTQESHRRYVELARLSAIDDSWVQPVSLESSDPYITDPFVIISRQLTSQFIAMQGPEDAFPEAVTASGFSVAAQGVARCSEAYLASCQETMTPPSSESCIKALKNPGTIRFFMQLAGMQSQKNRRIETWMGIRSGKVGSQNEFIYNPELGFFEPNPEVHNKGKIEAIQWALSNGQDPKLSDADPRNCPAQVLIPKIWEITIDACDSVGLLNFAVLSPANQ